MQLAPEMELDALIWALCEASGGAGKGKCEPMHCACGPEAKDTIKSLHAAGFEIVRRNNDES